MPAQAFLGLGNNIQSTIPEKAVQVDGRATEWALMPVLEVHGLSFRAMNDESNLYLLLRGTDSDGRIALSGQYRQNVTLWFLKPDGKTKAWGITFDFLHALATDTPATTFAALGISPTIVRPQGLEVSTATFPTDMELQADLSSELGRQPVYEMRIPLERLEKNGRTIYAAFVTEDVPPELRAELQAPKPAAKEDSAGGQNGQGAHSESGGGGGHHGHHGGAPQGGTPTSVQMPIRQNLPLTIHLVKIPHKE